MMRRTRSQKAQDPSKSDIVAKNDLPENTEDDDANMLKEAELTLPVGEEDQLTTAKAIMGLTNTITEMKNELKQELSNFKMDINQKLLNINADIRNQGTRLTEAEQRINELEAVNMDLRGALRHSLTQQKILNSKVTDLEGRSRRNNMRIFGIKEGAEGTSMVKFVNNFLKTELALGEDMDLQIQRSHRSLGPKPRDNQPARSILVNFQRFDIKDKVLRAAWSKKITYEGKAVSFANDLPAEINNKMKEYKDIKRSLKEASIRFQTPYPARMKIHWEDGPRMYKNASEVAEDMKKRGFAVDLPHPSDVDWEQVLSRDAHWNRMDSTHTERVRDRLRDFHRD
ncbi:hypothetical protein WMY93_000169 [Mugilogobius chulae]|uniref:L1 transposable element RRM domain-containing protein n=1 Tax=Mugilogobius chulae TaxID=88201 RepID=A0AAW0Q062_9GOBI